jgi:hypothetical protein
VRIETEKTPAVGGHSRAEQKEEGVFTFLFVFVWKNEFQIDN